MLTAAELGEIAATSASRITTLELALTRLWYFPRSSFPKSDRLYSARSSSDADLAFFIDAPFVLCCDTCVDDSDGVTALGVRHNQKPALRGHSESDYPVFIFGVIGIGARHCQWIMKRTGGFLKCYFMLVEVLSRLDGVPFEMHGLILSTLAYPVPLNAISTAWPGEGGSKLPAWSAATLPDFIRVTLVLS